MDQSNLQPQNTMKSRNSNQILNYIKMSSKLYQLQHILDENSICLKGSTFSAESSFESNVLSRSAGFLMKL